MVGFEHVTDEYLVAAQRSMEVTVFRRSNKWRAQVLTSPNDVFESRAVQLNIALEDLYEGVQ